jgi:hypothetical protein
MQHEIWMGLFKQLDAPHVNKYDQTNINYTSLTWSNMIINMQPTILYTTFPCSLCILHATAVTWNLLYYLTHSWSWALLEKLPIVQPFKKFPAFYGTRRFITVFTRALHWSLFWAALQRINMHSPLNLRRDPLILWVLIFFPRPAIHLHVFHSYSKSTLFSVYMLYANITFHNVFLTANRSW